MYLSGTHGRPLLRRGRLGETAELSGLGGWWVRLPEAVDPGWGSEEYRYGSSRLGICLPWLPVTYTADMG